jgi:hypothetical protein
MGVRVEVAGFMSMSQNNFKLVFIKMKRGGKTIGKDLRAIGRKDAAFSRHAKMKFPSVSS